MDDMQYAKYTYEIRKVLEELKDDQEAIENLVRNTVAYAIAENNSKTNWISVELFTDVISEEKRVELFDED